MTPDWAPKPTTVPYAKFGDPQSLNLYSYVENGPVNRIDPDGHEDAGGGGGSGSTGDTSGGSGDEARMVEIRGLRQTKKVPRKHHRFGRASRISFRARPRLRRPRRRPRSLLRRPTLRRR